MNVNVFGDYSATVYFALALGILYWAWTFIQKNRMGGEGISLFSKKNSSNELPFCTDLLVKAREGKMDPVIGRSEEIDRVIHILSRRTKNNPLLVGPAGVGKTAIVEGLAVKIASGDIPEYLKSKKVFSLNITELW